MVFRGDSVFLPIKYILYVWTFGKFWKFNFIYIFCHRPNTKGCYL